MKKKCESLVSMYTFNNSSLFYSPITNKTTDPINLGLWLFFAFFRGEKRADYLKKGKRLWKS